VPANVDSSILTIVTGSNSNFLELRLDNDTALVALNPKLVGVPNGRPGKELYLAQSIPNPMTSNTRIAFVLPSREQAELRIYDLAGRLVRELVRGVFDAGEHVVLWDGRSRSGEQVRSGVYFSELRVGSARLARKLVFVH